MVETQRLECEILEQALYHPGQEYANPLPYRCSEIYINLCKYCIYALRARLRAPAK